MARSRTFVGAAARHRTCKAALDYSLADMGRFRERVTLVQELVKQRIS